MQKRLPKPFTLLMFFFLLSNYLSATPDCPIITGRVTTADGTTSDPSATGWYLDASRVASTGIFAAKSRRIHAQELGGEGIWYSRVFSTAGYSEFQVAVKVSSEGDMNSSEYVRIYYKVNGGAETLLDSRTGNFGTIDFISPVLTGSNVQLVVKLYNYNNGGSQTSKYYIEEYRVFKEAGPCTVSTITATAAAGNGGVLTCTNPSLGLSATATGSGTTTWNWTGPNGFTSTVQNPTINAAGTYTVVATNSSGTGSASVTVTENKTPPEITATGGALACGSCVTISATSNVGNATYSWSGPGNFTSNAQNPSVCAAGTYTVTVTNPANGCSAQQSVSVTAGSSAPATFWLEDFSGLSNGTTSDGGTTAWTTSATGSGTYSVQNNEYKISFSGSQGVGVWTSQAIDISSKSNVSFSVDLRSSVASTSDALENSDYIRVYYKLNGGAETLVFEDLAGIGSTTNTTASTTVNSSSLNGSTLQIIIKTSNSDPTERYFFDNINVTGTAASTGTVTVTPSVNGTVTCINTAQLSATATGTVTGWSWTGPNGFTSAAQNPVVNAGGQYIVTATLSSGCAASATITVPENKTPPDISATGGTLACLPSVTLNVNSTVNGATYRWTGPNNYSSTSKNPSVSAAGTYTVTVTNPSNGCTAQQLVSVTTGSSTPATFWLEDFSDLGNGATSDAGVTAWTATSGGGGTYSVQNNEFKTSFTSQVEGVWTSQAINIAGKSNVTFSVDLRSEATPNNAFETLDYIRVYYKLNGGEEILVYEDLAGIGSTTNGTASTSYTSASLSGSTLQVIIKTSTSADNERYYFDNIKVIGSDIVGESVTATAGGVIGCTGNSVTLFGNAAAGGVSYSWTGPNNFTSNAQNPVVSATGTYTLTVHNPATGCSGTDTALVALNTSAPGASASANGSISCNSSSSVTLSGSSSTAGVTYSWTGPNNFTSAAQNPVVTVAGVYNLTVTNPVNGCTSTANVTVPMSSTSTGTIWLEDFTLANGVTSDAGATAWTTSKNPSSAVISVLNNELRVTNCTTTGEVAWTSGSINISGKTNIVVSAGTKTSVINNVLMNDSGELMDYLRFYYKLNNGAEVLFAEKRGIINNHSTTPTPVSVSIPNGNYSTLQIIIKSRATANDEFYYVDNIQVVATTQSSLNAVATATDILSCTRNSVGLTGSSSATSPVNYSWTGPDNFTSTVQNPSATAAGIYTLTVTDQSTGCSGSDTALVSSSTTAPGAAASANGSLDCNSGSITLSGSSPTSGVTYSWTGPNNFTSAAQNPVVTVAGVYNLTVTNPVNGCTSTASATVTMSNTSTGTIWLEDFTLANGVTSDAGATAWTTSKNPSSAVISVLNNELRVTNCTTTGEVAWTSGSINISGKTNIVVSAGTKTSVINNVLMNDSGELMDYLRFYYKLNNGAEVLFAEKRGIINNHSTTPTPVSVSIPNGNYSTLQIIIKSRATANDEFYYVDNIQVVATTQSSLNAVATATDILSCTRNSVGLTGSSSATSPVNYSWTGPDNFTSTVQNPSATAAGIYTLTVTDPSTGCTANDTALVSSSTTAPGAAASANGSLNCNSVSATLSGSSPTSGVTYSWTGPNNFTSTAQNPVVTTAGAYNLTVTNPVNGCTSTASATVTQSNTTTSTWLEDFAGLNNGTTSDAGATAWTTSKTVAAAVIAVENNELRITNCTTTGDVVWTSASLDMTGKTNISISAGVRSSVINNAVMNTDATYGDYIRFYYKLNNGNEVLFAERTAGINNHSTTPTPVSVTIPAGNYSTIQVVVRARATGNDEFYYFDNMQVVSTGTASISASATGGAITCTNNSVTLQGSSAASGVNYTWNGPNGYTSSAQNPTVTAPGNYTLTVALGSCTATASATVSRDTTRPNIVASANPIKITCIATNSTLTGSSTTPGVSYSWSNAGGVISGTANASVNMPGIYTLTVTNPVNGCSSTSQVAVTQDIETPTGATATHAGIITCTTPSIGIMATISTPNLVYSWSGPNNYSASTLNASVNRGGTYIFTATNPNNGCYDTATTVVEENTTRPGEISINNSGTITCLTKSVTISGSSSSSGVNYRWEGPNNYSSNSSSATVSRGGIYTLTATNPQNGCTSSKPTTVAENTAAPVINITNTSPISCANPNVTLTANTNTPNASYMWLGPEDFVDVMHTTTVNIPGTYIITVTNPANGCFANDFTEVTEDYSDCAARRSTNVAATKAVEQNTPVTVVTSFTHKAYPNPVITNGLIEFTSPQSTNATVGIYNALGTCEKVLFKGNVTAGRLYRVALPATQLSAGAYYYLINTGGKTYTGKLVIVK
ncbi:T9SS type A sorting domain-containing protein [Niastella caeni]|uniref:T9SS type A sorting domain-containing protein n=1 Tax=Niastella caeni TaxID=2569763 RepID=A0A4S8HWR3_9BACT|nr:T9SS type A sorting domain-containing protein [Niastella caeni]THU40168.1 T9SS type A sorting domain-containing protein [Niastella caeni]